MKFPALLLSFILLNTIAFAQHITISGLVVDGITKDSLIGASVFAQNTTTGTITNSEGKFSLSLKQGGYDLIISYTGYYTQTIRVTSDTSDMVVQLMKEDKSMSEVVIQSTNEVKDGWEQYGSFFIDHFIGTTPFAKQTSLLNPEVLKFFYYRRSNKLKVLATEPLMISNQALGYTIRYELDSFIYNYPTEMSSYRGNGFFTEDTASSRFQQREWNANREKVYYGSKMHFIRSYYDGVLKEEGFLIDVLDEKDDKSFYRIANPYDSTIFFAADATNEVEIYYPTKMSILYTKKVPEPEYLIQYGLPMDVKMQISYVDILHPIILKENGYYFQQKDWINQGYWSWKNIADLLPFDYMP